MKILTWALGLGLLGAMGAGAQDCDEIARLIERMGDESYAVREAAYGRLLNLGKPALPQLEQACRHGDPEIADRARRLYECLSAEKEIAVQQAWCGSGSLIKTQESLLVWDASEWQALWRRHAGASSKPPTIDFSTKWVAALFFGEGGRSWERSAIKVTERPDCVQILLQGPGIRSSAGFVIVALPRSVKTVLFQQRSGQEGAPATLSRLDPPGPQTESFQTAEPQSEGSRQDQQKQQMPAQPPQQ